MNTQSASFWRAVVPNLLTSGNLLCGVGALVALLGSHRIPEAALLMGVALVLDVFDGLAARLLKVDGDFGKQLDSLADVVSFGVLPAAFGFELVVRWENQTGQSAGILRFVPFLLAVFAALRLAKFNLDAGQKTHFLGLPTPSMAAFFGGWAMAVDSGAPVEWHHPGWVAICTVGMCALMVSEIPLFSLKKTAGKPLHPGIWILLGAGLVGAGFLHWWTLPLVVVLYPLVSLVGFKPSGSGSSGRQEPEHS